MMPGMGRMDPKKMQGMMRQMGIKSKEIDAEEVIIKTSSGELIISNPQVTEVTMQGIKTYQVMGEVSEKESNTEDVNMIVEKTGCTKEQAEETLEKNNGDIAAAILELS